jgi:hypothetical protein
MEWRENSMTENEDRPQSPGLKWRQRRQELCPYWFASPKAIKAGYPLKSANLSELAHDPDRLLMRAQRLQWEMEKWLNGDNEGPIWNGTFKSLFDLYERDKESTFHGISARTRKAYLIYLRKLYNHIGALRIDACDGRDVKRWFADWRNDNGTDRLPRARMALAVLKAAISFGIVCRKPGCGEFKAILGELEFDTPDARTHAPTADQIIAARKAAHENKAPLRALLYALQFDTGLRQEDIAGQWVPLEDPRPSAILHKGQKWIGPNCAAIENNILRVKPSKTADTTGVVLIFDLSICPMVMEEIGQLEGRTGPLIINEHTGKPYRPTAMTDGWRADYAKAGLPGNMWNRDIRAGAITEGRRAKASKDDIRKLSGHAKETTTDIYDRDQLEAQKRVMTARVAFRDKNNP